MAKPIRTSANEAAMYYHLCYYLDWLSSRDVAPLQDMEICLEYSNDRARLERVAGQMNALCLPSERFRVYESPSRKLSKKSKLIYHAAQP